MSQLERKTAGMPTLKRLLLYLRLLRKMKEDGEEYASGTVVAKELGLDPDCCTEGFGHYRGGRAPAPRFPHG